MSKHTPGPWVIYPGTDGTEICAVTMAPGLPIRQVIAHPVRGANWIDNARVLAASPDMLAALKSFVALCPSPEGLGGHAPIGAFITISHKARAAIAKAEGA
jgi:hypothetical protein